MYQNNLNNIALIFTLFKGARTSLFFSLFIIVTKRLLVFRSQNFELMDTSRLMSCKKIILVVILDLKVNCSFMYQIASWLNVESSASLLSHPFILNFLTLGFCFPQPRPRVFSLTNMAAAGPKPVSKLSICREKSREIVAHSLAARFASLLRACSQAQGFH